MYIASQIFVVLMYVFLGATYFCKDRKILLILSFLSLFASGIAYVLLSAWSGLAMCVVAVVRNTIFMIQNKNNKTEKFQIIDYVILAVLIVIIVISAVLTYDGFLSLMSVFATTVYTVSVWQKNIKVYNILGVVASMFWITYNVYVNSLFGIILEACLIVVEIIGTIKSFKQGQVNE